MNGLKVSEGNLANLLVSDNLQYKNIGTSFKSMLSEELTAVESFDDMWQSTIGKYFGQYSANFYHIMDASSISQEVWTHNDFPYEKFLTNEVDVSVLNWKPTRSSPSQPDSDVQSKLTATLGKHSMIIPPELDEKLKTDPALRKKVLANVEDIYKFHKQPPAFKMPGVKEYGTKIYGSVTILNAEGDVENCVVTSGGTIMEPDEETLRQIEVEHRRKLKRKEFNSELLEQAQIRYLMNRDLILSDLNSTALL